MRKLPSEAKVSVKMEKKGLSLMITSANLVLGMSIFDDMNLGLFDQITGKRNSVPVDMIIFLQHQAAFI